MSVAAQKWAWDQNVPPKAKLVLVTFADQADARTGHVCYQRTDAEFLAEKCGMPERTMYRWIAALIRNGYLLRESGRGKKDGSAYWLRLDRETTLLAEWSWVGLVSGINGEKPENIEETQDVDESAKMADLETSAESGGLNQPYVADQDSFESPKIPEASEQERPRGFSRGAQDLARGIVPAQQSREGEFVIEGTRAWDAWMNYRRNHGLRPINSGFQRSPKHPGRSGHHFPSLFPPNDRQQAAE